MENEAIDLVHKLVGIYMKEGPSKALSVSYKAVEEHSRFALLHRLHAMYIFESDPKQIQSALKSAKMARSLYPLSLEYRFFQISLMYKCIDNNGPLDRMLVVWESEDALNVEEPQEPYWDVYMVDNKETGLKMDEKPVDYLKLKLVNSCCLCRKEIDDLPKDFFLKINSVAFNYPSECYGSKRELTRSLLNGNQNYHCSAIVPRLYSEFCFEDALQAEGEERKWLQNLSLCSAKTAHRLFDQSIDYLINWCARTLQCSDCLSLVNLGMAKFKLTNALSFDYSIEPYYQILIKDQGIDFETLLEYYKNCVKLLLTFITTLEERFHSGIIPDNNEEFSLIYYRYLEDSNLREFAEKSSFFYNNIKYLLENIPELMTKIYDVKSEAMSQELMDAIGEIVNTYNRDGASEAKILTNAALQNYETSPLLLRLHAKYIFENDSCDIESALKYAKMALLSQPDSLDHRFYHAFLLYQKGSAVEPNDNMLLWEIVWECDEALGMEKPLVESLQVLQMVNKNLECTNTEEEASEFIKTLLYDLINMCYRKIDGLPKSFFDIITSDRHDMYFKRMWADYKLNTQFRFCAFVSRLFSEFCFISAQEASNSIKSNELLLVSQVTAKEAHQSFKKSAEYEINYCARLLQCFDFSYSQLQFMKENLEICLCRNNTHEPYYEYLVVDNDFKDHAQQKDYFNNCIGLLLALIRTIEEVNQNKSENGKCKIEDVYYKILDEFNLRDFAGQSSFFERNIRYLLEHPPKLLEESDSLR